MDCCSETALHVRCELLYTYVVNHLRFKFLMAVSIALVVVWGVTWCYLVDKQYHKNESKAFIGNPSILVLGRGGRALETRSAQVRRPMSAFSLFVFSSVGRGFYPAC